MIWKEAALVLRAAGLEAQERSFGLEGSAPSPAGPLHYQLGKASAGGCEMSVRSPAGPPVRWFQQPSVAALTARLIEAQGLVNRGAAPSLLEALLQLDPR